jgi:hypothetical protein
VATIKFKNPGSLFFIELQQYEVVIETPGQELERRVRDSFERRQVSPYIEGFAQSVLDDMMLRDEPYPGYGRATAHAGWWVELPYPFGRQWVPFVDRDRDIVIDWGPLHPEFRFKTRDLIDRCSIHIEVCLDELLVEWFRTPREVRVAVPPSPQ